jgi:aryl-alcohol dehydrogenase-like predicted oxidoreductase
MTGSDTALQQAVVDAALAAGINWFDTAPGYGQGRSEANLGAALAQHGGANELHIATKVRIPAPLSQSVGDLVRQSLEESQRRLRVDRVALLQLHNGVTRGQGDEPDSLTPEQILQPRGVLAALERLRDEGLVDHLGLTGTGHADSLRTVVRSAAFDTIQIPYNLLNPSAGTTIELQDGRTNYGNLLSDCAEQGMGVFAIRVFAGGALLGLPPSDHTLTTRYFPLALYEADLRRAEALRATLDPGQSMHELAIRFVLSHPSITSALIGLGSLQDVRQLEHVRWRAWRDP